MQESKTRMKNFVAGEFVEGSEGDWQEVINPSTGEKIGEVPKGSEEDVDRAVEAADRAFTEWFDSTPGERSEMLHALADVVLDNAEELAWLESTNVGKPITMSREGDGGYRRQLPLFRRRLPGAGGEGHDRVSAGTTRP